MRWLAVLALVVLSACTSESSPASPLITGRPVAAPYAGPMDLPISDREEGTTVLERTGVAGRALECDGPPFTGQRGYFGPNLERVRESAEQVLADYLATPQPETLPPRGYRLERVGAGRALFSLDVEHRTKVSFVAVDGVRDAQGRQGWAMEAYAQCDPAELPAEVTEALGIGVWQDRSGQRIPVTQLQSSRGAEHCDWQHITFLRHGRTSYLRDERGTLAAYTHGTFARRTVLPPAAKDTGYHRDGRELWVVPGLEEAYLVALGDATDVERWPAAREPIGCA